MIRYRAGSRTLEVYTDGGMTTLRARDLTATDWDQMARFIVAGADEVSKHETLEAVTAELAPRRR